MIHASKLLGLGQTKDTLTRRYDFILPRDIRLNEYSKDIIVKANIEQYRKLCALKSLQKVEKEPFCLRTMCTSTICFQRSTDGQGGGSESASNIELLSG